MIVYVIFEHDRYGEYQHPCFCGVFSSLTKAEEAQKNYTMEFAPYCSYSIKEYKLDEEYYNF